MFDTKDYWKYYISGNFPMFVQVEDGEYILYVKESGGQFQIFQTTSMKKLAEFLVENKLDNISFDENL